MPEKLTLQEQARLVYQTMAKEQRVDVDNILRAPEPIQAELGRIYISKTLSELGHSHVAIIIYNKFIENGLDLGVDFFEKHGYRAEVDENGKLRDLKYCGFREESFDPEVAKFLKKYRVF